MKRTLITGLAVACLVAAGTSSSGKAAVGLVDFENNPSLPTAPSIYVAVPGPQTIVTPQATFSGGVVLGFATFFPAISFATAPNVYGSADFGNKLSETLNIAVNPALPATEVSFALFNGEVFNQSYAVNAFNGTTLVASQVLSNVAPNFNSGYGLIDLLNSGGITNVTVTPVGAPSSWDFLIDTIGFNENINGAVLPPVVLPPPVFQPPATPGDPQIEILDPIPALPPAPPVQARLHGHGEFEPLEIDFGDNANDVRGSTVPAPAPEPATAGIMLGGLLLLTRRGGGKRRQMA